MVLRMTPIALAIGMLALPQLALAQSTTELGNEVTLSAVKVVSSTEGPTELPKAHVSTVTNLDGIRCRTGQAA